MKIFSVLFLFISTCSVFQAKEGDRPTDTVLEFESTLIVYLSRTQNTRVIAEIIQKQVGGTLLPLELVSPYPADYDSIVRQVQRENETGFLPPLKTKIDLAKYDTVFLGFPTWGMRLPPPVKSFLAGNDLSGKTVIPFNTHAGYGVGSGFKTVKALCMGCDVLEGFSIQGGIERDGVFLAIKGDKVTEAEREVKSWLHQLKILTDK